MKKKTFTWKDAARGMGKLLLILVAAIILNIIVDYWLPNTPQYNQIQ